MEKVKELVSGIRENLSQQSASRKDETRVMKAMLNDREYKVGIYGEEGLEGEYCPAADARSMISSIISSATSIKSAEAEQLANVYDFKNAEATTMVNISKEFVNTYVETGRKLPLGGREESNVSLCGKRVEATTRTYPKKVGVDDSGKGIYEKEQTVVPAHDSIRVIAGCPTWVSK